MEQAALDFVSAPALRQIARRQYVLRRVAEERSRFHSEFPEWISHDRNLDVWERFRSEADAIWNAGRRHYSPRTIWEVMRHESALREDGGPFKLNDKWVKSLSQLYLLLNPERAGFFELRERAA